MFVVEITCKCVCSLSFVTFCHQGLSIHRWRIMAQTYNTYNIFMFDNKHANQGSQCSSVLTYTLVVHNTALYRLGGAQDNFTCSLRTIRKMVYNAVLSVSKHLFFTTFEKFVSVMSNYRAQNFDQFWKLGENVGSGVSDCICCMSP